MEADLADGGDGVDLDVYGVTSSMVYWADVMYAADRCRRQPPTSRSTMRASSRAPSPRSTSPTSRRPSGDEKDFIESMIDNYDLDHPDEPAGEVALEQGQRPSGCSIGLGGNTPVQPVAADAAAAARRPPLPVQHQTFTTSRLHLQGPRRGEEGSAPTSRPSTVGLMWWWRTASAR